MLVSDSISNKLIQLSQKQDQAEERFQYDNNLVYLHKFQACLSFDCDSMDDKLKVASVEHVDGLASFKIC